MSPTQSAAASRRGFLKSAALLASVPPRPANSSILAYVGTYSSPQGPEGAKGRGQGIYLFEMSPATGALKLRQLFADPSNPAWLALDASRTRLYSANHIADFEGAHSGSVSAWAIDRASGHLNRLNTVSSHGANPCHLSLHPSGKFVLVANYHGGTVAVQAGAGIVYDSDPATEFQETCHKARGMQKAVHLAAVGLDLRDHQLLRADCLQWLAERGRGARRFGLVYLAPPTFSNSKRMGASTFDVQRDHAALI